MTDMANLPDDPRDCCRAALKLMRDDFHDAQLLVDDLLDVIFSALMDEGVDHERVRSLLHRAQNAAALTRGRTDAVRKLVRHGAGDCRELDAMLAERRKALEEGREPPYSPTWGEVRGAMIASEAAGKPISEEEATEILKAKAREPEEAAA